MGEYIQHGCEIDVTLDDPREDFLLSLIEAVEAQGLIIAGGCTGEGGRFFVHRKVGSVTEEDRHALQQWFAGRPDVRSHGMGPLVDAWH